MTIEELIQQSVAEAVAPLHQKLDLILSAIVVQQKDASRIAGVSDDVIRRNAREAVVQLLQRDGSRLNYLTLKDVGLIKRRRV